MRQSIETLADQIRNQPHLSGEEKAELLDLIADIEAEVGPGTDLPDDGEHPVKAAVLRTLEGAAGEGASEAEGDSGNSSFEDGLLQLEANYPRTAAALGRIGHVLARMGI